MFHFFLSSFDLLRTTDIVSAIQNLPTTLPLPFGDFKLNIWSLFSWLIPFPGPIAAFFFILVFRPCLLKYLISFNRASRLGRLNGLRPQLSLFGLSNSTLFSLMTHTWIHRQEQLYIPSPPEVVTGEETFVPTPPNQNRARSLRVNLYDASVLSLFTVISLVWGTK